MADVRRLAGEHGAVAAAAMASPGVPELLGVADCCYRKGREFLVRSAQPGIMALWRRLSDRTGAPVVRGNSDPQAMGGTGGSAARRRWHDSAAGGKTLWAVGAHDRRFLELR